MADDEYAKKLKDMQQYIPFLEVMITQLKDPKKKNREQQLQKMESLYAMITDEKKKLKYETLVKCEDVIKKIQNKVTKGEPESLAKVVPPPRFTPRLVTNVDSITATPASPSPPPIFPETPKPIVIPIEKVTTTTTNISPRIIPPDIPKTNIERPNVYSSAAVSLNTKKSALERLGPKINVLDRLGPKVPDMSKPPLTMEDLELLQQPEDDYQSVTEKSLDELEIIREQLKKELNSESEKPNTIPEPKTKNSLDSKFPLTTSTSAQTIANPMQTHQTSSSLTSNKQKTLRVEKVIKEPDSIFGNILSSLDGKIMEDQLNKKKDKKVENKKEKSKNESKSHKDKEKSKDSKKISEKTEHKTTVDKKNSGDKSEKKNSHEKADKKSSLEKSAKKKDKDSKEKDKKDDSKVTDKKEDLKDKEKKEDFKEKDRKEASKEKDKKDSNKEKNKKEDSKEKDKKDPKHKDKKEDCSDKDQSTTIIIDGELSQPESKETVVPDKSEEVEKPQVYKRLADKYKPKPRKHSVEEDVEKQIEEKILKDNALLKIPFLDETTLNKPVENNFTPTEKRIADPRLRNKTPERTFRIQETEPEKPLWLNEPSSLEESESNWFQDPKQSNWFQEPITKPNMETHIQHLLQNSDTSPILNTVVNQLRGNLVPINLNTNMGNKTPCDPFLNSPTNIVPPTLVPSPNLIPPNIVSQPNIIGNINLINQNVVGNPNIGPTNVVGNPNLLPSNVVGNPNILSPNLVPPNIIPNQQFRPQHNQVNPMGMNQMPIHPNNQLRPGFNAPNRFPVPHNHMGNGYPNNFIPPQQNQPGPFYPEQQFPVAKKSFNPFEPIGGEQETYDLAKMGPSDFYTPDTNVGFQNQAKPPLVSSPPGPSHQRFNNRFDPRNRAFHNVRFENRRFQKDYGREKEDRYNIYDRYGRDERINKFGDKDERIQNQKRIEESNKKLDDQKKEAPKESKYDAVYSKLDTKETKDVFSSPLDSLYTTGANKTGKGYGVQKFKIPKIKKPETVVEIKTEPKDSEIDDSRTNKKDEDSNKVKTEQEVDTTANEPASQEKGEASKKEEEEKEIEKKDENQTPNEHNLLKMFMNNLLEVTPDKKEVLLTLIESITGSLGVNNKKKYKKIRRLIDSDTSSDEEDVKSATPIEEDHEEDPKPTDIEVEKEPEIENKEIIEKKVTRSQTKKECLKKNEEVVEENQKEEKVEMADKPKPKSRRFRTELDMLHEDIKEMFIRDGVLTATGKRMCRILKDDPQLVARPETVAVENQEKPKRTRKELKNKKVEEENEKKAESDDDDMPLATRLKNIEKAKATISNPTVLLEKTDISSLLKQQETQENNDTEEDNLDTSSETVDMAEDEQVKVTPKTPRKKKTNWSMGVIKKRKRKTSSSTIEDTASTCSEVDLASVEQPKNHHDIEYYFRHQSKLQCRLCSFCGKTVVWHYKTCHPADEVYISRFSPTIVQTVLKISEECNIESKEPLKEVEKGVFNFLCPFCETTRNESTESYYDHISSHTGEYRHRCNSCSFHTSVLKSLKTHVNTSHNTFGSSLYNVISTACDPPVNSPYIIGYLCKECNYTQLIRSNMEDHVNKYHENKQDLIVKIHVSAIKPSEIPAEVPKESRRSTKKETHEQIKVKTPKDINEASEEITEEVKKPENIFTTCTDLNEENNRIQQERLEKMREINTQVKRTNLSFIEKLKTKLDNQNQSEEKTRETEEVVQENIDTAEVTSENKPSQMKPSKHTSQLNTSSKTEIKKNVPVNDIIQRLQGQLTSEREVIKPPPLIYYKELDVANIFKTQEGGDVLRSGPIIIRKVEGGQFEYLCLTPSCIFNTSVREDFEQHIEIHKDALTQNECEICLKKITVSQSNVKLTSKIVYDHIVAEHFNQLLKNDDDKPVITIKTEPKDEDNTENVNNESITALNGSVFKDELAKGPVKEEVAEEKIDEQPEIQMAENSGFPFVIKCVESEVKEPELFQMPKIESVVSLAEEDDAVVDDVIVQPPPLMPLISYNSLFKKVDAGTENQPTGVKKYKPLLPKPTPTRIVLKDIPLKADEIYHSRKSTAAECTMLELRNIVNLYKCPIYVCHFTTNVRKTFDQHMLTKHPKWKNSYITCLYCNFKTHFSQVTVHLDVRHGACRYACPFCFFRAYCLSYVEIHQTVHHAERPINVLELPPHKDSMLSKGLTQSNLSTFIPQYKCSVNFCGKSYLTKQDFAVHLRSHQLSSYQCHICQFSAEKVMNLLVHYSRNHGYYFYNCAYCKYGNPFYKTIYKHQAQAHFALQPNVICRSFANYRLETGTVLQSDYLELCSSKQELAQFKHMNSLKIVEMFEQNVKLQEQKTLVEVEEGTEEELPMEEPFFELSDDAIEDPLKLDEQQQQPVKAAEEEQPKQPEEEQNNEEFEEAENGGDDAKEGDIAPKEGLIGEDLYLCTNCLARFKTSTTFRSHLNKCAMSSLISKEMRPFACAHCVKRFKNSTSLVEHIRIHGASKFKCSLCNFMHAYNYQVRAHMKSQHKIYHTLAKPEDPKKKDIDQYNYIVRPKLGKRKSIDGTVISAKELPKEVKPECELIKKTFGPSEIQTLPRQAIYSTEVSCAVCGYATKVRTNLVRHLEFHLQEKDVPSTAPVNPVPCLEKNEKMFDKMTNLAISSMTSGRMAGKADPEKPCLTKEEEAQMPAFVPATKRFVCGAEGCNYLSYEESLLKHHIVALHMDETNYTCAHCKEPLVSDKGTMNVDQVIKHLKLHDLHLYKCGYCKFVHNLKHKVERHLGDKHLDRKLLVITVREIENPNIEINNQAEVETPKESRIWRCGMCKYRAVSNEEISFHTLNKHDIDSQFKCALCTYKTNSKDTFQAHFNENHPGCDIDIIDVYYKLNENSNKPEVDIGNFDTTPLWQRDRPRVRHIRGILLDDCKKLPKKSPIRLLTEPPNEVKIKPNKASDKSAEADSIPPPLVAITGNVVKNESALKPPSLEAEVSTNNSLIKVLNSELKKVLDDEDSKSSLCKSEMSAADSETDEESVGVFGPYGSPVDNLFLCPVCGKFSSQFESDVMHHLYHELEYYRYKCELCHTKTITLTFLHKHSVEKHKEWDPKNMVELPSDLAIESWVQKVLEVQKRQMTAVPYDPKQSTYKSMKFEEYETVEIKDEDEIDIDGNFTDMVENEDNLLVVKYHQCPYCNYQTKYFSDIKRHEMRHWVQKPFKCGHCTYEAITRNEVLSHSKRTHKAEPIAIKQQTMPETPTIIPLRKRKRKTSGSSISPEQSPVKKSPSTPASPPPSPVPMEKNETEPTETVEEILVCKHCPKRTESKAELNKHWELMHKSKQLLFEYITVPKSNFEKRKYVKKNFPTKKVFKFKCSNCNERFEQASQLRIHSATLHPETVKEEEDSPGGLKKFKCSECGSGSNSYKAMKNHLRNHAKPYKCGYCSMQFNYPSLVQKHQNQSHPNESYSMEVLNDCIKFNAELRDRLLTLNEAGEYVALGENKGLKRSLPSESEAGPSKVPTLSTEKGAKNVFTARKKTTQVFKPTARKSTTHIPKTEEGYSYYGTKPVKEDLKKIKTYMIMGGDNYTTLTIEQFSLIFNLFPKVMVEDCKLNGTL